MSKKDTVDACDKAITEIANGKTDAISVIYDLLSRMIFSAAYAITENHHDSEDVLQNTMIAVMKYADTYRSGTNAIAWIMSMARHIAIDTVRKRKNELPLDSAEQIASTQDASLKEVFELLNLLEDDEKQIVVFRLHSNLPYGDISEILGISVSAAQKKYQRAIKKLQKHYKT